MCDINKLVVKTEQNLTVNVNLVKYLTLDREYTGHQSQLVVAAGSSTDVLGPN